MEKERRNRKTHESKGISRKPGAKGAKKIFKPWFLKPKSFGLSSRALREIYLPF
jgi:hypothetical protein